VQATVGDRICIRGYAVEVRGDKGQPPYLVRFGDGQTRLLFPGPDAVIEHPPGSNDG